jgi:hypothetical protein
MGKVYYGFPIGYGTSPSALLRGLFLSTKAKRNSPPRIPLEID